MCGGVLMNVFVSLFLAKFIVYCLAVVAVCVHISVFDWNKCTIQIHFYCSTSLLVFRLIPLFLKCCSTCRCVRVIRRMYGTILMMVFFSVDRCQLQLKRDCIRLDVCSVLLTTETMRFIDFPRIY